MLLWNRVPSPTDRSNKAMFELDFEPKGGDFQTIYLPFTDFVPYDLEGRPIVKNPPALQLRGVRWFNFIIRSYYKEKKEQEGKFWLAVKNVRVVAKPKKGKCLPESSAE